MNHPEGENFPDVGSGGPTMNPAMHRKMSVPFANLQEFEAAATAFIRDLNEVRQKHKMPQVYCVFEGNVLDKESPGGESLQRGILKLGDMLRIVPLVSYCYGLEIGELRAYLAAQENAGHDTGLKRRAFYESHEDEDDDEADDDIDQTPTKVTTSATDAAQAKAE